MALQNYSIKTIKELLAGTFYIPNYQREYSWESAQVEDFWNDLDSLVKEHIDEHFFGQVLIHSDIEHGRKYLIDGQQRTTTSLIFARALYKFYSEIANSPSTPDELKNDAQYTSSEIAMNFVGRYTPKKDDLHLHLGNIDHDYFRTNIQLGIPPEKKQKSDKAASHERIRSAYWYFIGRIKDLIAPYSEVADKLDILNSYYDAFTNKFKVMYIEATDLGEAFIIFETLNARGKDLGTSDLLKNYIFSKDPTNIHDAEVKWTEMLEDLGQADPTKYIRCYWNSRKPFIREKALYREICKKVENPRESRDLLNDLKNYARYYSALVNPQDSAVFGNSVLNKRLQNLKMLKAASFYPVVLAMCQTPEFTEDDLEKVVKAIETLVFRNFTILGQNPNKYEVLFSDLAYKVFGKNISTSDEIVNEIKKQTESDSVFEAAFAEWSGAPKDKEKVRYILREIHKYLDSTNELNIDNSEVHIEHIMPEDFSQWTVSQEEHDQYLWRLGNLALLSGPINISISNKPFAEKQAGYSSSKIEPNSSLCTYTQWTKDEIIDRQKKLAKLAVEIWK